MFFQRAFRALWVLPVANGAVGIAALPTAIGAANLVMAALGVLAIKAADYQGKIDFFWFERDHDRITPQDPQFRSIHEQL